MLQDCRWTMTRLIRVEKTMADFTSDFWHWFIVILTLVSILALIPFLYMNREKKPSGSAETMGHVWDDDLEEYNNPLPGWWFNMFVITLVFGLVYLALYPGLGHFQGLLNWSSKGQYDEEMSAAAVTFDPLFDNYALVDIRTLSTNESAMKTFSRSAFASSDGVQRGRRGLLMACSPNSVPPVAGRGIAHATVSQTRPDAAKPLRFPAPYPLPLVH